MYFKLILVGAVKPPTTACTRSAAVEVAILTLSVTALRHLPTSVETAILEIATDLLPDKAKQEATAIAIIA